MRFSHTLMLWILGCLSALFALSALALFGIGFYAKSHSYQATIQAHNPASIAPPPQEISNEIISSQALYTYRVKLAFPSVIFRYQKDFTLLTDLDSSLRLSEPSRQLIAQVALDKNYLILQATKPISSISGTLDYTISIARSLWLKLLYSYLALACLCLVLAAIAYKYQALQNLAAIVYSKLPSQLVFSSDSKAFDRRILALCAVVFLAGFGLRWWYMGQKVDLHGDEVWSVAIASHSNACLWGGACEDGVYYGKEIKERELWHSKDASSALKDIANLYLTNNGDSYSHANLYYTILRLWHIGVRTGDIEWIIQRGVGLNLLLFYPLAFLFAFLLGSRLFGNSVLVPVFLALALCNGASISATMLIREYALQECLFLGFAWAMAHYFCSELESRRTIILSALLIACFLLSGYFVVLYVGVVFALLWFLSLGESPKKAKSLLAMLGLAVVFTYMLYPIYHKGFVGGHATSALARVGGSDTSLLESMRVYGQILGQNIFTPLVLLALLVAAFAWYRGLDSSVYKRYLRSKEAFFALLLGGLAVVFGAVIMFVAPWKILRFVVGCLPLASLLIVVATAPLLLQGGLLARVVAVMLGASLLLYHQVGYLRYPHYADFRSEPIYQMEPILDKERADDREIPTIYSHSSDYGATRAIIYFNDLRLYHFIKDPREALKSLASCKQCYFITALPMEAVRKGLGDGFSVELTQATFGLSRYYVQKIH